MRFGSLRSGSGKLASGDAVTRDFEELDGAAVGGEDLERAAQRQA